jgi:hypothetical protein
MWIDADEPKELLRLNHALDVLGLLSREDRYEIADALLTRGIDLQPLIDLCIAGTATKEESADLLSEAARLIGASADSMEVAARRLVRHVMESVLSERYSPFFGLGWLQKILDKAPNADTEYVWGGYDCARCCGLYWDYEEGPVGRRPSRTVPLTESGQVRAAELDAAVIDEAAAWLERNPTV